MLWTLMKMEHPLPDDIQQMDRDDTVCKFCGVSYLIHHEIKQMQNEVHQFFQWLQFLNRTSLLNCDFQIADLKKQLEIHQKVISDNEILNSEKVQLEHDLSQLNSKLTAKSNKLEDAERRLEQSEKSILGLEQSNSKLRESEANLVDQNSALK